MNDELEVAMNEMFIELSPEDVSYLDVLLSQTSWVDLPFCEASTHLREVHARGPLNGPYGAMYFGGVFMLQTTDERRSKLPVTKLLGLLFAWETEITKRGVDWFNSNVENLLSVLESLKPEADAAFLALMRSLNPSMEAMTERSAAARKAAIASHKEMRENKSAALSEWDARGTAFSGMAAFARHRHKAYDVTERTLYRWVSEHRKAMR